MEKVNLEKDHFSETKRQNYDMIVFCHLRWDFVYQRPQHIISRMAEDLKILFIEEPVPFNESDRDTAKLTIVSPNLHVLQPKTGSIEEIKNVLTNYVNQNATFGWFYSAAFVSLLSYFRFESVIYDCMDELTLFKGAPQSLLAQEQYLIDSSDVIFTGGKSLYDSKKHHHDNVHCFPSSVDRSHFAKAMNGVAVPEDIAGIKGPIVGYFGVIDERLNLELLNATAIQNPDVSFVLLGPVAKINDADLPRQSNIHYLGMKPYAHLPNYLKAFTLAMMPFALNDATKFISPTKTLEYMAAGKPIISTPIKDVVRDYSDCIAIVENADQFTEAISSILEKPDVAILENYHTILEQTSWAITAEKMKSLINKTVKS